MHATDFFYVSGVISSAVTRAILLQAHTHTHLIMQCVHLFWFTISIQRKGSRCDCQQGHESNLKTIPGHGVNLQLWLSKEAG